MGTMAFAGTAPFAADVLNGLLDGDEAHAGREVALVLSQPDRPAGRGRKVSSPAVASLARERGLELVQPERTHDPDVLERLRELQVDTIVVAAFGQMIREPLLSEFLMLNVHGSLLPAYRGAAPIERAIMDGLRETGVCIMQMEAGLDTGPVAAEARVAIGPDDDAGMVYAECARAGVRVLHEVLHAASSGTAEFVPQREEGATYASKITAEDRRLDLAALGAVAAHDRIRALSPHIGAFCEADGTRLTLWRTRVVQPGEHDPQVPVGTAPGDVSTTADGRMFVTCADGVLEVVEAQPAGKRRMPVGDWLRGLREPLQRVTAPALT